MDVAEDVVLFSSSFSKGKCQSPLSDSGPESVDYLWLYTLLKSPTPFLTKIWISFQSSMGLYHSNFTSLAILRNFIACLTVLVIKPLMIQSRVVIELRIGFASSLQLMKSGHTASLSFN